MLTCLQPTAGSNFKHAGAVLLAHRNAVDTQLRALTGKGVCLQVAQRAAGAGSTSTQHGTGSGNSSSSTLYLIDKSGRIRSQVCSAEL